MQSKDQTGETVEHDMKEKADSDTATDLTEDAGATETEKAVDPVERPQGELDKLKDDYLRLGAEFDNYKKRTARNFGNLIRTANEEMIVKLLDVLDNFERAFQGGEEKLDIDSFHQGITLVYDQFKQILAEAGLSRFESVGEKFDPNLHEAMMQMASDEHEPDHVAAEFQAGYKIHDKVVRHARVGVVSVESETSHGDDNSEKDE